MYDFVMMLYKSRKKSTKLDIQRIQIKQQFTRPGQEKVYLHVCKLLSEIGIVLFLEH